MSARPGRRHPRFVAYVGTVYPTEQKVGEDLLQRLIVELLRPLVERWLAERGKLALTTERGVEGLVPDFALVHLGAALRRLGRFGESRETLMQAIPRLFASGNWLIGGLARAELGAVHLAAGDAQAALDETGAACEILARVPLVRLGADVVSARALLAMGETERAVDAARAAEEALDRAGCVTEADVLVRLALADALEARGDGEAAQRALGLAADLVRDRADRIPDPAFRRSFLEEVQEHASVLSRVRT